MALIRMLRTVFAETVTYLLIESSPRMLLQHTILKITSFSCIATYHTHIHTYILSANVCMRVCLCVCPSPRLLITSGVMWCNIDPI